MARINSTLGNVEISLFSKLKRYLFVYSAFIFATVFPKTPGPLSRIAIFFPDINIIYVFFIFFWSKEKKIPISTNDLFFFGLIVDVVNFLPIGLSSLSFLASFRIMLEIHKHSTRGGSMLYFMGNIMLFMSIYMSIQWFAYSAYKNVFSSFTHVILNISKNSAYSFLSYPLWKKYKNV